MLHIYWLLLRVCGDRELETVASHFFCTLHGICMKIEWGCWGLGGILLHYSNLFAFNISSRFQIPFLLHFNLKHFNLKPSRIEWIKRNHKLIVSNKILRLEAASSSSVLPPPWIELPGDVTANILRRLGSAGMLESAQRVCTTWWKVCQDPAMWRVINLRNPLEFDDVYYNMMCRRAVDLSQGQLIDLSIEYFGDDELIDYISNRSSHLQRLTIAHCCDISGTPLSEAAKKLPQLEELHLMMVYFICGKDIEAIGISCPMLKSFSYHWCENLMFPGHEQPPKSKLFNEYALAIGKTMPNLRHLQLLANWMNNEGLEAVLDGCPLLESLDIRGCWGVHLQGALGKRCQQIKNLRDPSDPISNFEWLGVGGESFDVKWCGERSRCSCSNCFDYYYGDEYERVTDLDLDLDGYD